MNFPIPIDGQFCPTNPRKFTLNAEFVYNDPEKDIYVVVPAGFVTDGNSVPKAFWSYFAPWEVPEAGVIHDWLYKHPTGYTYLSGAPALSLSRAEVDDIHRRILHLKGVRWSKRQLLWSILRAAGSAAWNRHRNDDPSRS